MIEPPGVERHSVATSLGNMVYYTPSRDPWPALDSDSRPTLVFLHGFGGGSSAYEWSKVYPAFAHDYRVLAPDLIGWGRSHHPDRKYCPEDYVATILEFIEQTCPEPVAVVASSLTGAFTIRAAIERPELFASLILTAPAGLADFGESYGSFVTQILGVPVLDRVLYSSLVANAGGIRNFLETRQFANPERVSEELVMAYLASAQQSTADRSALAFVRGDLSFDLARYLPELAVPTVFLWGSTAQFTSAEVGRRLANLNPTAVRAFVELPGVGLTPHLELPSVAIAYIRKYLNELTPTAAAATPA